MTVRSTAQTTQALTFLRLWAAAHVIHLWAASSGAIDSVWALGVIVAAAALIVKPLSRSALTSLALFQIADYLWEMPFSPDHWAFVLGVNLVLLTGLLARRQWRTVDVVAGSRRYVLAVFAVGYGATVVAKYNSDFFDPVLSCAGAILEAASGGALAGTRWSTLAIAATVLAETSVLCLILLPRTRRLGAAIGFVFHFTLMVSPLFSIVDFTCALFAVFLLLIDDACAAAIVERLQSWGRKSHVVRDLTSHPIASTGLLIACSAVLGWVLPVVSIAILYVGSIVLMLTIMIAAVAVIVPSLEIGRSRSTAGHATRWALVAPIVLLAWVSSPYIGLRTTGVLAMFSNLQTEGEGTNHLFMPSFHVVDWQQDYLTVVDANEPPLADLEPGIANVTTFSLRRLARSEPNLVVNGTRDGTDIRWSATEDQDAVSWLARRTQMFRPFATGTSRFCPNA